MVSTEATEAVSIADKSNEAITTDVDLATNVEDTVKAANVLADVDTDILNSKLTVFVI